MRYKKQEMAVVVFADWQRRAVYTRGRTVRDGYGLPPSGKTRDWIRTVRRASAGCWANAGPMLGVPKESPIIFDQSQF